MDVYYLCTDQYVQLAGRGTQPVPGAAAFVSSVRRHGLPCAVATSASRRDVFRLLREIGLDDDFATIVTAQDVAFGKPHPEVYLRAAEAIGVEPRSCLAFEDSLVGVTAAGAAGMTVIGVTTAHTAAELAGAGATSTIETFEGLTWPL